MPIYIATRDLSIDQKDVPEGGTVDLSGLVAEQLLAIGAIRPQDPRLGADRPLAKMKKEELLKIAADEEVEVPDGATIATLAQLIEQKRAGQ